MHYRNGREAKNGDKVIQLSMDDTGRILHLGVLFDAFPGPGNDYCNSNLAPTHGVVRACVVDCLHLDDIKELLKEKDWNKRPAGK